MRRDVWEINLDQFLLSWHGRPFRWGSNDCVTFAAKAVLAMTGEDYRKTKFDIPDYHSRSEAREILRRITGINSLPKAVEKLPEMFGFIERPVRFAQRGDLALIRQQRVASLGVVMLDGKHACGPGVHGLMRVRLHYRSSNSPAQVTRCWAVS